MGNDGILPGKDNFVKLNEQVMDFRARCFADAGKNCVRAPEVQRLNRLAAEEAKAKEEANAKEDAKKKEKVNAAAAAMLNEVPAADLKNMTPAPARGRGRGRQGRKPGRPPPRPRPPSPPSSPPPSPPSARAQAAAAPAPPRPSRVPTALRKAPPRLVSVCDAAGVLSTASGNYQATIRSFARQQSGHPLTLLDVLTAEDGSELTIDFPRTSFSDLLIMVREAIEELPGPLAESLMHLETWHEKLKNMQSISVLMDEVALSGSIVVGGSGVSLPTDRLTLHIGPIVVSLDDLSALGQKTGGVSLALPHTTLSSVVELAKKALAAVDGSSDRGFLAQIETHVNQGPKFVQARAHRRDCAWWATARLWHTARFWLGKPYQPGGWSWTSVMWLRAGLG